ncbi:MAG: TIGR02206 family membrane protein [Candidatus Dormiibacterota bacterium]
MTGALGATHLLSMAVIALAGAGAVVLPPRWSEPANRNVARGLAVLLLGAELSWWLFQAVTGGWRGVGGLPLQLCDLTAIVGAAALWTWRPLLAEITWFWGIGGALQALLTPELPAPFPSWLAFQYYIVHGGAVVAAILLVIGLRRYPRAWAVPRMILVTGLVAVAIGIVDWTTGADYLFLRSPPPIHSLLSVIGGWPRYPVLLFLLGVGFLLILDLPFFFVRRIQSAGARPVKAAP